MRVKTKQESGVNLGLVGLKTVSGTLQVNSGPCQVGYLHITMQNKGLDIPVKYQNLIRLHFTMNEYLIYAVGFAQKILSSIILPHYCKLSFYCKYVGVT